MRIHRPRVSSIWLRLKFLIQKQIFEFLLMGFDRNAATWWLFFFHFATVQKFHQSEAPYLMIQFPSVVEIFKKIQTYSVIFSFGNRAVFSRRTALAFPLQNPYIRHIHHWNTYEAWLLHKSIQQTKELFGTNKWSFVYSVNLPVKSSEMSHSIILW